jgi:hypothetical protein
MVHFLRETLGSAHREQRSLLMRRSGQSSAKPASRRASARRSNRRAAAAEVARRCSNELCAFLRFPRRPIAKLSTTNALEWLDREIGWRISQVCRSSYWRKPETEARSLCYLGAETSANAKPKPDVALRARSLRTLKVEGDKFDTHAR